MTRPLAEHYTYVFVDGTCFTMIYDGEGAKTLILAGVGIQADGTWEVLAFTVGSVKTKPPGPICQPT